VRYGLEPHTLPSGEVCCLGLADEIRENLVKDVREQVIPVVGPSKYRISEMGLL